MSLIGNMMDADERRIRELTESNERLQRELEEARQSGQQAADSYQNIGEELFKCAEHNDSLTAQVASLREAVQKHYDANGHDLCWENDDALYAAFGLKPKKRKLPSKEEFTRRCAEYRDQQYDGTMKQNPATDSIDGGAGPCIG